MKNNLTLQRAVYKYINRYIVFLFVILPSLFFGNSFFLFSIIFNLFLTLKKHIIVCRTSLPTPQLSLHISYTSPPPPSPLPAVDFWSFFTFRLEQIQKAISVLTEDLGCGWKYPNSWRGPPANSGSEWRSICLERKSWPWKENAVCQHFKINVTLK